MLKNTYLCIDKSGSTRGAGKYWQEVGDIMERNQGAKVIFWDMEAHETGFTQALGNVKKGKMGDGGTDPQCFATLLPENIHLVIVTDGQVPAECIKGCDGILQGRKFAQVEVHYLSTGGAMNLSVSAPFTRKTNYQIFVDGNMLAEGNSIESIDLEPYFDEPEKFILESDEIVKKIVIQNLGKNNSSLRNGLLNLQKNLLNCIAKRSSSENEDRFMGIREMLKKGEYEKAIEAFKNDILAKLAIGSGNMGTKIEAIIRDLTNLCSGYANYSFDLLQPGRLKRAAGIAPVRVEELPAEEEYEGKYECPIMLDREMPCCMVKAGEPVLKDLEKKYLDDLMTNPLMLLQNSGLIDKLRQRIDLAIGQQSLKSIFAHNDDFYGQILSPFTRAPICGAFTFGLDGTHLRSNNFVLANLFFGANKLVGLSELWLAVVYFVIRDKVAYLSENAEFMAAFREHLVHRMERAMTNVTLSGLPIEPFMKSPVDIAIWYCVVSPHLQKWTSTESAANRLRSMGVSAKWLLELLDLMGMTYDREWTVHRLALYKAFAGMMRAEKDSENKEKWRKILRGQYQNSMQIAGNEGVISIVMLDGPPQANAEMRPKLPDTRIFPLDPELGLGELMALAELVDPRKSINDVEIPEKLEIKPTPHFVENYGYLKNDAPSKLSAVQICPKTMRPYSHDLKSGLQWKIASENAFGPLNKQISLNNYFGKYVVEKDKYPESKAEFILYLAVKQENRGDGNAKDTLPAQIAEMVDALFERFEGVAGKNFANVSIEEFRQRFQASANLEIRAKLDGTSENAKDV